MKWVLISGRHINTDQVQVFWWTDNLLEVWFAGDQTAAKYHDPDKYNYYKLCRAVGVRPVEEETCQ